MGVSGWLMPSPGCCIAGNISMPLVVEIEWTPGPVWTGVENLAPPGFDPCTVHV